MEEKREMIHKILDLVIDINGFEARAQEKTGHKPTAFVHFNGHIAALEVEIFKKGWSFYTPVPDTYLKIPLTRLAYDCIDTEYDLPNAIKKLEEIRKELEEK